MGKLIAVSNQKGGVGKTTTTLNIGVGLSRLGKKILLVDLDPQSNLTSALGFKNQGFHSTIYDILKGEISAEEAIIHHRDISLLPSSIALSGADIELASIPGREQLLKEYIQPLASDYDCILIDCPPTLGLLTLNALTAAHGILIPIQAEYIPLEGVKYLLDTIEVVKKRLNSGLELTGVIVTLFDTRQNLHREVAGLIRDHFKERVFSTFIRKNISLAEAPSFGLDIFSYKSGSTGAIDYSNLSKELIARGILDN